MDFLDFLFRERNRRRCGKCRRHYGALLGIDRERRCGAYGGCHGGEREMGSGWEGHDGAMGRRSRQRRSGAA